MSSYSSAKKVGRKALPTLPDWNPVKPVGCGEARTASIETVETQIK